MTIFCDPNGSCFPNHFTDKQSESPGNIEVLDEHVLWQHGYFKKVRRWLLGQHPSLGILHQGYAGWETIQEVDVISPLRIFTVLSEAVKPTW